jgi:hypothetical protein
MARSRHLHDILDRLAAAEEQFLASEFLAPVPRGGRVEARIAGVVCGLTIAPAEFAGWGIFQATSPTTARLVRRARLAECRRYLDLFPLLRLILCRRAGDCWVALPAHQADSRFHIQGTVPVYLVDEAQTFDVIRSRFDGARCWFDGLDACRDPGSAAYLRAALSGMVPPEQLSRPGLTAEERTAYTCNYLPRLEAETRARQDRAEARLRAALGHAGAELHGYLEREDCYRVEYVVDGERQVSVVRKGDLSVQAAGICLSGQDGQFDLQSLVGVVREGLHEGELVRVNRP